MHSIVYEAFERYYNRLEKLGYIPYIDSQKLLLLFFYYDYTLNDYCGIISYSDYRLIEKVLDCLYGSSCLIPYPDYLKMGKLRLCSATELATRVKNLEDTPVLKLIHDLSSVDNAGEHSDILVEAEELEDN